MKKLTLEERKKRINDMSAQWGNSAITLGKELKETRDENFSRVQTGACGQGFLREGGRADGQTWEDWVKANTCWSITRVRLFIRICEKVSSRHAAVFPVEVLGILADSDTPAELRDAAVEIAEEGPAKIGSSLAQNTTGLTKRMVRDAKVELVQMKDEGKVVNLAVARKALKKQQDRYTEQKEIRKSKEKASPAKEANQCLESAMVYQNKLLKLIKKHKLDVDDLPSWRAFVASMQSLPTGGKKRKSA